MNEPGGPHASQNSARTRRDLGARTARAEATEDKERLRTACEVLGVAWREKMDDDANWEEEVLPRGDLMPDGQCSRARGPTRENRFGSADGPGGGEGSLSRIFAYSCP